MRKAVLVGGVLLLWVLFLLGLGFLFNRSVDIGLAERAASTKEAKLLAAEVSAWER